MAPFREREVQKDNLLNWVGMHHNEDAVRKVFLNMDIALKYIHDHGYCIEVFYPTEIEVLNDNPDYIQFNHLMELSSDPVTRKQMIKEDIFNSSLVQIGIYTNTFKSLTPSFLREHFDELSRFIPEGDVPYYRGVVQRGATVYLSEFAVEKTKRDLQQLNKQLQEETGEKQEATHFDSEPLTNDRINDSIYKQINGLKDVAFINYLLIPTIVILSLVVIGFLGWIISLF